jgi:hypothetical protein
MQKIIAEFSGKYALARNEVISEIEIVFSSMLSRWYNLEVMVFFREDFQFEAIAYDHTSCIILQKPIDLSKMKGRNTLKKQLEMDLAKASVLKQTARYKPFERGLIWGEVSACDPEHNLHIDTEIISGERITAVYPSTRIGLHKRRSYTCSLGKKLAFHLRQVEPEMLNETPRLKIIVDRVSKTLVETLLKSNLPGNGPKTVLRCVKRYVGQKSIVLATSPLPKTAIIAVDRELKERVQVEIVKSLQTQ